MILYPENIDSAIGFDEIKYRLIQFAKTHFAKHKCEILKPSSNPETVKILLQQTLEMQRLLKSYGLPELILIDEIKEELKKSSTLGNIPHNEFLNKIKRLLSETALFFGFFDDLSSSFPILNQTRTKAQLPLQLFQFLNKILDEEGNINPFASPELKQLIDNIIAKEKEVRKLLNNRFDVAKKNGWAGDTEITIRNDRLVIPIIAEFKKKIKGLVHDDSASGKFLYIEPLECFEENNRLRELYIAKKKEIERILRQAGKLLTEELPKLESIIKLWEELDFFSAKAKLNELLKANIPEFASTPKVKHFDALHPLLLLNAQTENKEDTLVRNSLSLDSEKGILLLSGPNAGGKSVLLKTAALLQIMFQSGLGITASPASELYVFKKIFVEISDNQSIENALSTYSAHLVHMKYILENSDEETFLAIDELGTGTDPALASPLAESMMEALCETGAMGIVSSHLGNLKKLAEHTPRLENASMQYDPTNLKPLFKLVVGRPGSSFAFELAQNLNFPKVILDSARLKMKENKNLDFEELNLRIEKLSFELEEAKRNVVTKEVHLDKMLKEYDSLKNQLKNSKNQILKQAREQAAEILMEASVLLKKIKKTGNQVSFEKTDIEKLSKQLTSNQEILNKNAKKLEKEIEKTPDVEIILGAALAVGDFVKIKQTEQVGEIIEINKNKALVLLGDLRSLIDIKRLDKLKNKNKAKKENKKLVSSFTNDLIDKQTSFKNTLDLRGERGDIALLKVEKWLDDAYLLGSNNLKILHGKGEGILKKFVLDFLKTHPHIKSWKFEHEDRGGDGATLVELR